MSQCLQQMLRAVPPHPGTQMASPPYKYHTQQFSTHIVLIVSFTVQHHQNDVTCLLTVAVFVPVPVRVPHIPDAITASLAL